MIFRSLWSFITASGLLFAVTTAATGQEASEDNNSTKSPAANAPAVPSQTPATGAPVDGGKVVTEKNADLADKPVSQAPDKSASETKPTDTKSTDAPKSAEPKSVESKSVDPMPADGKGADAKVSDKGSPEKRSPEKSSTEKSIGEKSPSEAKPAHKAPVAKPQDPINELIDKAILETGRRKLTAGVHTPWQIVHGILAMRWELMLQNGTTGSAGSDLNAIEWITSGVYHEGLPLWEQTPYGGRGHPYTHPYAFEGHPTQFMGYMTMANIPLEYEVKTPTKVITIRDIINDAKMQVHAGVEITWTLWALAHYEEPDAKWFNAAGEPWSIERLVKMQVDEAVTSGACGGCHGLFALAYARNMYLSTGKPLRGVWFEADQKIKRYIEEARTLQNADGTFSANHFKGPGLSQDFPTRIATSGHQLEWLMVALPQSRLKEEWVRKGITAVANELIQNKHVSSDCGPLFHGVHSLVIYRQRTVPGYLVPKFNSNIKLTERNKKKAGDAEAKTTPSEARRPVPESRDAAIRIQLPAPVRNTERVLGNRPLLLDFSPTRK